MFGLAELLLPIGSALISAGVGAFALYRRETTGARAFAVAAFSQASWSLGYACELASRTLGWKLFWDDFQFLGAFGWVLGFAAFAELQANVPFSRARATWIAHGLVTGSYLALVLTDRYHGLIRPEVRLVPGDPFDALVYPFTLPTWIAFGYVLAVFAGALLRLLQQFQGGGVYRRQLGLVLAGVLIPILGMTLTILDVLPLQHRDTTPLTFALGNLLVAWGLFRHGLLDLVPIARGLSFEQMPGPVIVLDARGRVVDMNPAGRRLAGASARLGAHCSEVFSAAPELVEGLLGPAGAPREVTLHTEIGPLTFVLSLSELRYPAQRSIGRVAIAHDVSELKLVESELAEKNRELESANRELDAFAHSVSHDLRAPLRTITRFAEIALETQAARLDARGREQLELVCAGTQRMRGLIDALLTFSRSARQPLHRQQLAPAELVREVIEELGASTARQAEFSVSELPECSADRTLLRQVFLNLIDNAVKYSRDKHPPRIAIGTAPHDGSSAYFVRDNGAGFDMRYADRLFGVFQRLHDAHEYEGSGVGLAIAQRIVLRHGGRIWAEAAIDAGATFYFTLGA